MNLRVAKSDIRVGDLVQNAKGKKAVLSGIRPSKTYDDKIYIFTVALDRDGLVTNLPGNLYCFYEDLTLVKEKYHTFKSEENHV